MVDPLNAWWAQQLVLCDWAFAPDPLTVDAETAVARLSALGVVDRGELGWCLLESLGTGGQVAPARLLAGLELIALAGSAGWLSEARARGWAQQLAEEIATHHSSLDAWLSALLRARSADGWVRGDDGFYEACEALAVLEHDGAGVTWEMLQEWLAHHPRQAPLWPAAPEHQVWRLRAAFSPVLELPAGAHDWQRLEAWLVEAWQIHDRDELLRSLLWLAAQGDRQGWDLDAARLLEADGAARRQWQDALDGVERDYGRVLLGFLDRGEPLEWAAWDWLRLVDLAWAGACLGWLDEQEAQDFAHHGADLLLRRYSDWTALVRGYQRGRSLFEGRNMLPALEADWSLLLHSPVSPWKTSLQGLVPDELIEASRDALRAWRRDPRHWVLALAAVREPEFTARQGTTPPVLPATRREEARHYLAETLDLHADEGVDALSRYWLPAQAHHLNQLAADAAHGALPAAETPFGHAIPKELAGRDGLKQASRHAATIHMAEKFAFHLQMAMDSGDFDATRLAALARSLQGSLCRFYPDARRLLQAWAQWESLLPEPEQPPMLAEIRWHLEDPGSLFHWLDWRVGEWCEPGPRPTLWHFTAMALVGPLNSPAWSLPQPESQRECAAIREWVDGHYALHGAAELTEFLDYLIEAGDRQEYQINYAPYTLNRGRLASEIAILESDECSEEEGAHLLRLKRVRDDEDGCNDIDLAAWDIAQAVDLAIAGRQLGWLEEPAFLRLLERAHGLVSEHYAGWEEYARGLHAGFSFFMGETPERESFLAGFRQALVAWLSGAPPLAGAWASLDFPGARPRHWAPLHIDTLPGDHRTLH
ncbi:DUF1266 domain-containing protein [Halomonas saccharevitans]|uniref:DUF1266 domain-containing protein n=1 Tax=Halomonas saccharevitans TaxID=416872 RepID=A0A1I6YU34_9GAMM|nr:DUF1266 domain-containing protein [Halomonas saccharevitans]SFT53980.1 Protein of unknown function [Halomonas saccharevitans]